VALLYITLRDEGWEKQEMNGENKRKVVKKKKKKNP